MRIHRHLQRKLQSAKSRGPRGLLSRGSRLLLHLSLGLIALSAIPARGETVYVVERERGGLAIIEDEKWVGEIAGLGDTSHTTVKFSEGYGYAISRDGYISQINPKTHKIVRKVKVGNSGIGLNFVGDYIAVANYDPPTVVILDQKLNPVKTVRPAPEMSGSKHSTTNSYLP